MPTKKKPEVSWEELKKPGFCFRYDSHSPQCVVGVKEESDVQSLRINSIQVTDAFIEMESWNYKGYEEHFKRADRKEFMTRLNNFLKNNIHPLYQIQSGDKNKV